METLLSMPTHLLRSVDIQNTEEEQIVQDIINSRFQKQPIALNEPFLNSATDFKTPEEELAFQAKLDEKKAKLKALLNGETISTETTEVAEPIGDAVPSEVIPETTQEVVPEVAPEIVTETVEAPLVEEELVNKIKSLKKQKKEAKK